MIVAGSNILWSNQIGLLACDSAGSKVYFFTPDPLVQVKLSIPTYEQVRKDREMLDYSLRPRIIGYRAHFEVEFFAPRCTDIPFNPYWTDPSGEGFPDSSHRGLTNLLGYLTTVGSYLMVHPDVKNPSYHPDGWKPCVIDDASFDQSNLDGKNVGLRCSLKLMRSDAPVSVISPPSYMLGDLRHGWAVGDW